MLSLVTREDHLAIFQKLTPVSLSRFFRTCKWVNQCIEDNKHKIKIHLDKDLFFSYKYDNSTNAWRNCIEIDAPLRRPIQLGNGAILVSLGQITTIPYELAELESILSDARFQCFVFESVKVIPTRFQCFVFESVKVDPLSGLATYPTLLEQLATIPTRKLTFDFDTGDRLPTFRYNYEHLRIRIAGTPMLDATFDLVETQRNVRLEFDTVDLPVDGIAGRCCELMRKIMEGRVVNKQLTVEFEKRVEQPAVLDRFFREKESETVVLADRVEFHLLPVSQRSFLAVQWRLSDWKCFFESELIENRETFYGNCCDHLGNRLPDIQLPDLLVVQQICNRFFS